MMNTGIQRQELKPRQRKLYGFVFDFKLAVDGIDLVEKLFDLIWIRSLLKKSKKKSEMGWAIWSLPLVWEVESKIWTEKEEDLVLLNEGEDSDGVGWIMVVATEFLRAVVVDGGAEYVDLCS